MSGQGLVHLIVPFCISLTTGIYGKPALIPIGVFEFRKEEDSRKKVKLV